MQQSTARQPGARFSGRGASRQRTTRMVKKEPHRARNRMLWKRRMFLLGLAGVILCALFLPLQIKAWRLQSELNQLQTEKQALLQQQQQIQQQIGYYNSDAYVEEAARRELGLVKPGEFLVLPAVAGKAKTLPQNYRANVAGPIGD